MGPGTIQSVKKPGSAGQEKGQDDPSADKSAAHSTTAIYRNHFDLTEAPFSIAPDPRFIYMSQRHQDALAHLLYGLGGDGGFVLLTGEVGTGKTTICRCLLEQIPEFCDVAYIFNPKQTVEELLSTICLEFGIKIPSDNTSIKMFVVWLNAFLLHNHAEGRNAVLIIDEAQNLAVPVLEQMRLLTNLETNERKLLQIILIGQPELATILERPELRQLSQRIVARYHLGPLNKAEVAAYVEHRLDISGAKRTLFPKSLMGHLHKLSGGIPRVINILCDRALLGAFTQGREHVRRENIGQAAKEVFHQPPVQRSTMLRPLLSALVLVAGGAVATAVYQQNESLAAPWPLASEPPAAQIATASTPAPTTARAPVATATAAAAPANSAQANPAPAKPAVVPAAKPTAPLPETLEWPADQPRDQSRTIAYAALFKAWGADEGYAKHDNPCRQAEPLGLRCNSTRGGLDELRQFNRPAVMHMRDAKGREFYATLTALDNQSADFAVANETRTVALDALAAQWSGYYTVLLRIPPEVRGKLRPGERGPAVDWLAAQLAKARDKAAEAPKDAVFDNALRRRLKQFQLAQGLVPDSKPNAQTLMRLSSAADQSAPKLRRDSEAK
jgi:general secretion pathway protein A